MTRRDMIKRGSHPGRRSAAVPARPVASMLTTSMTDVPRDSGGMLPSIAGDPTTNTHMTDEAATERNLRCR